jgi:hypothetical protein
MHHGEKEGAESTQNRVSIRRRKAIAIAVSLAEGKKRGGRNLR